MTTDETESQADELQCAVLSCRRLDRGTLLAEASVSVLTPLGVFVFRGVVLKGLGCSKASAWIAMPDAEVPSTENERKWIKYVDVPAVVKQTILTELWPAYTHAKKEK